MIIPKLKLNLKIVFINDNFISECCIKNSLVFSRDFEGKKPLEVFITYTIKGLLMATTCIYVRSCESKLSH